MHLHGDKFGDGKFSYELGDVSNVSIVFYDAHVKAEDRHSMTHQVCYAFCRTIPDMNYFGLTHGRDCYCAPYFKQMAGDSSNCDAVCEGDPTTMCGGMSKSSIFEMHSCNDAAEKLKTAADAAAAEGERLTYAAVGVADVSAHMQSLADALQPVFGTVGDTAATASLQAAKVFAGTLEHAAEKGQALVAELKDLEAKAAGKQESDAASESVTYALEESTAAANHRRANLWKLWDASNPAKTLNVSQQYRPIMYFVDKNAADAPATCGGTPVGDPIVGSREECATACDAAVGTCVGFMYLAPGSLCFLFSKFTTATYYTACKGAATGKAFLQSIQPYHGAADVSCVAKFSDFEGIDLTPDPSDQCQHCLKKLNKAARCFEIPVGLNVWAGSGRQKEAVLANANTTDALAEVPQNNCPYGLPFVNTDMQCSDLVTPYEKARGITCGDAWMVRDRCNQPSNTHLQYWQDCQFCAQTCSDLGLGYEGLKCK
jgi:hypothetical protein